MFRVIVCGGRDFVDRDAIYRALDKAHAKRTIGLLMTGDAPGAEVLAQDWARARHIVHEVYRTHVTRDGSDSLHRRNQWMLGAGANGVVAFPGVNQEACDLVRQATMAGVPVWRPFP